MSYTILAELRPQKAVLQTERRGTPLEVHHADRDYTIKRPERTLLFSQFEATFSNPADAMLASAYEAGRAARKNPRLARTTLAPVIQGCYVHLPSWVNHLIAAEGDHAEVDDLIEAYDEAIGLGKRILASGLAGDELALVDREPDPSEVARQLTALLMNRAELYAKHRRFEEAWPDAVESLLLIGDHQYRTRRVVLLACLARQMGLHGTSHALIEEAARTSLDSAVRYADLNQTILPGMGDILGFLQEKTND